MDDDNDNKLITTDSVDTFVRTKRGRPAKVLNDNQLDMFYKLVNMLATKVEIGSFFDMSEDTLEKQIKERFGQDMTFRKYKNQNSHELKLKLRKAQWISAVEKGNPILQIFLGKNYLGQTDKQEVKQELNHINISFSRRADDEQDQSNKLDSGSNGEPDNMDGDT